MQTHAGKIRLLPAWPKEWDVDFRLHAPRQAVVEGSFRDGKLVRYQVTPGSRQQEVIVQEGTGFLTKVVQAIEQGAAKNEFNDRDEEVCSSRR